MNEIYISIDIEADGPIPGRNNMLSFGAAAFDLTTEKPRRPIATFEANLDLLEDAVPSPSTMRWWATQPKAWDACRTNLQDPKTAMPKFLAWVRALPGKPVIVGYPVTFDFLFLYWYAMAFGGLQDGKRCPFGFQGLDIKTLAMATMGGDFKRATKRHMPRHWHKGAPKHNHEALTDAIGQGVLFVNIMQELRVTK